MRTLKIRLIENAVKEEQNFLAEEYTQKFARSGLATIPYNTTAPFFVCVCLRDNTNVNIGERKEGKNE